MWVQLACSGTNDPSGWRFRHAVNINDFIVCGVAGVAMAHVVHGGAAPRVLS
jgi:hypothetical protein